MPSMSPLRWSPVAKPLIGMLHLPPLPGSPGFGGSLESVRTFVLRDAEALVEGGVHALMLENFGDAPFFPDRVPPVTIACMSALAVDVRRRFDVPLGVNVLRNDGRSALAVALAAGGAFIRVNVLCGARVTDQGLIQGIAHELLRDRAALQADIEILADVDVKHSAPLAARPLEDEIGDTIARGRADAIVVSGRGTGNAVALDTLRTARIAAGQTPILVGSGASAETAARYLPYADGLIVGTALKRDGVVTNPVDPQRVRGCIQAMGT